MDRRTVSRQRVNPGADYLLLPHIDCHKFSPRVVQ